MVANKGMVTLVVLLDYSAAFDTVDHSIMLQILGKRCGLSESVLQWHTTCLQSRTCAVVAGGMSSDTVQLECSLPQGSSLGPLKFIIYAAELHECIARHGIIMVHSFADDTQLCIQAKVQHVTQAKQNMVAAIADISRWSSSHRLKLNPDKSDVIRLGTQQQLAKLSPADKTLQLHDSTLMASTIVRNLGVQLDSELNFDDQARCCVKACYYHLRRFSVVFYKFGAM